MSSESTTSRRRIEVPQRKVLLVMLTFVLVVAQLMGMSPWAQDTNKAFGATPGFTIGAGYHITDDTGNPYQIDPGAINGVIYVDTTDAIIIQGNGAASGSTANSALTIDCTTGGKAGGVNLTLDDIWISSPYDQGNVIDFTGAGNILNVADDTAAILESNGYSNGAVIHVAYDGTTYDYLTINGPERINAAATDTVGLYVYKSSGSAGIGGNMNDTTVLEASGFITFASGDIYVKGTQTGPSIGGDSVTYTNGDITISGGQLSVETNARGAAIGASNQGTCAGNVYVTGGSTLINVDWSGSAIGRGDTGRVVGNLYISGGSLKTVVDWNAAGTWLPGYTPAPETDTINNIVVTADKYFGTTGVSADVAEVDVSRLDLTQTLQATVTPAGGTASIIYNEVGLNQNDYTANQGYTPSNWTYDASNTNLYLYLPISPASGVVTVTDGTTTLNYDYTYDPQVPPTTYKSSNFDLTGPYAPQSGGFVTSSNATYDVTFAGANDEVRVSGTAVANSTIDDSGTLTFTIVPDLGYKVDTVSASDGTIALNSDGSYTLSAVTNDTTVTVTSSAETDYWSDNADTSWYIGTPGTYSLGKPAQLAGLAALVNSGTYFAGSTINLVDNIDLSAYSWVPIGGGRDLLTINRPVAWVNYFAGTFDGNGYTVSGINLDIDAANAGEGAYGLFGAVIGGTLSNVTVEGTIDGSNDGVGGLVGYTNGNITNVVSDVIITDGTASMVGGVAGIVDNADTSGTTIVTVSECANLARVAARSRLGGVVGMVQCANESNVVVSDSFNSGDVVSVNAGNRAYIGGVVGYCMGAIEHVYNTGAVSASGSSYCYVAGIVGLLNGANATPGTLTDAYNTGTVTVGAGMTAEPLYAFADTSRNVTISNCVYLDSMEQDQLGATWTAGTTHDFTVNAVTATFLASQAVIGGDYLTTAFTQYESNDPVLNWQVQTVSDGTQASFNTALSNITLGKNVVVITSAVAINSGTTTIDIAGVNGVIVQGNGYTGDLFDVTSGGTLIVNSGTIDASTAPAGSYAVDVNGGTFTITPTGALEIEGTIYLTTASDVINLGAALTNDITVLSSVSPIPDAGLLVATATTSSIASASEGYFQYSGGGVFFEADGSDIYAYPATR
jgi:hypothetical protein